MASRLRTAAMGLLLAGSLAGCMSMPSGGPVRSFAVTAGPDGQSQPFTQTFPQPPQNGWSPTAIVLGFITASASLSDQQKTAKEYLTAQFSKHWNPGWAANVYSTGPSLTQVSDPESGNRGGKGHQAATATVEVRGKLQATVANTSGSYVVASAKEPGAPLPPFTLVNEAGQWRISSAPQKLLLTSSQFNFDYQQRNLYFFSPHGDVLVPDPVYVPNQATPAVLMKNLVGDLILPPQDWLTNATATAFPHGTTVGGVTLAGTIATVDLNVARTAKLPTSVRQQISSQLFWTLTGSGQAGPAVQSIELVLNGKPWSPPGAQQDPVQDQPQYKPPASSKTGMFYYLDKTGRLMQQNGPSGTAQGKGLIGKGYSQIAVSPMIGRVQYVAALQGEQLYTGLLGGKLAKRGVGYTSVSWAPDGELWATSGDQVYMLPDDVSASQKAGPPVAVNVVNPNNSPPFNTTAPQTFASLRVAPDGVRVAIIVSGALYFGAIVNQPAPRTAHGILSQPGDRSTQTITKIVLSQSYVTAPDGGTFDMVTWYGPYNVITLGAMAPQLTEYPVNGGVSTTIPPPQAPAQIQSVTASFGWPLIASVGKGQMMSNLSPTGAWTLIADIATNAPNDLVQGTSPVYPG